MTIGERIKDARIKKGITQQQLAAYIKVAKSTVAGYETNQRSPDAVKICMIAQMLGVSGDYLIGVNHQAQSLSYAALELARQYDTLDERGQEFIGLVMEHELYRASSDTQAGKPLGRAEEQRPIGSVSASDLTQTSQEPETDRQGFEAAK